MPDRRRFRLPARAEIERGANRAAFALFQRAPLVLPARSGRRVHDLFGRPLPLARGVEAADEDLAGVPSLRLTPTDPGDGAIVFIHGGGFERGSLLTHRSLASHLAAASGLTTHMVDYRTAPEHPYPAALEDVLTAWGAVNEAGVDPGRIAVGGDSAGGGLTLALTNRLLTGDEPAPAVLFLMCPWLDLTLSGESVTGNARRDAGLSPRWLRRAARQYAGDADPADPDLSPLFADPLGALPPVHLQEATQDVLGSDAARFGERARSEGVELDHRRYPCWHGFQVAAALFPAAKQAVEDAAGAIRSVFARAG